MNRIFILFFIFVVSACTFQTKHRGYVFPDNLEDVVESIKTPHDLTDTIGNPQVKTIYGENIWIYYGVDENYRGPLPKTYDHQTVLLVWVRDNKIIKKQVLHDNDLQNVKIVRNETDIPAAVELNALEELFNNIGRFSPAGLGQ